MELFNEIIVMNVCLVCLSSACTCKSEEPIVSRNLKRIEESKNEGEKLKMILKELKGSSAENTVRH